MDYFLGMASWREGTTSETGRLVIEHFINWNK